MQRKLIDDVIMTHINGVFGRSNTVFDEETARLASVAPSAPPPRRKKSRKIDLAEKRPRPGVYE